MSSAPRNETTAPRLNRSGCKSVDMDAPSYLVLRGRIKAKGVLFGRLRGKARCDTLHP